jgi:RNA polymerase sigma factor (sigma-70 family)
MNALASKAASSSTSTLPSWSTAGVARRPQALEFGLARPVRPALPSADWRKRSQKWGCLMAAAQRGESRAYEQLLRELDHWLRGYYARRRLPPIAAEDARQEALLAVHANRHTYAPNRPFGPWVAAIARYKWVDHLRETARSAALSLDEDMASADHVEPALSSIAIAELLRRLKPAQATVIRLVKLEGITIEGASRATGQSVALVKVNIHRGLKKLTALALCEASTSAGPPCAVSFGHQSLSATPDVKRRVRGQR